MAPPSWTVSQCLKNRQEQTCFHLPAIVVEQHESTLDILTAVTSVTTVTVMIIVAVGTVERNKHVCNILFQFVSEIGIILDLVSHGSVPCRPLCF